MKKIVTTGMALSLAIVAHTCKRIREGADSTNERQNLAPVIEIAPLEQGRGQWKIAAADEVTVTVTAPGAERIQILGRPEGAEEEYLELRTLAAPVDHARGKFVTRLKLARDFAGDVWAEASYSEGAKRRTETNALTAGTVDAGIVAQPDAVGGSVGTDESARSNKLTGGRIRKTRLIAGEPDIRITVNAPAFLLTLWQNGKEVSAYHIGIGQKIFPVPIGEREATAIIFNPHWVPSDSVWAPYEKIKPNDPRPPLSKIKIPLGAGYMIHEATKADDIGRAVSHGSILMLKADLLDLAEKIITARNLPVTKSRIAHLGDSHERIEAPLAPRCWWTSTMICKLSKAARCMYIRMFMSAGPSRSTACGPNCKAQGSRLRCSKIRPCGGYWITLALIRSLLSTSLTSGKGAGAPGVNYR